MTVELQRATLPDLASFIGPALPPPNGAAYSIPGGNGVNGAIVQNDENCQPFWVKTGCTLEALAVQVSTLGASSTVRAGIRNDAGLAYPYPGTLITDYGTYDTSTTGTKTLSGLTTPLKPYTIYWLSFTEQGGTPPQLLLWNVPLWTQYNETAFVASTARGYRQTGISGALASPFSATILAAPSVPRPQLHLT